MLYLCVKVSQVTGFKLFILQEVTFGAFGATDSWDSWKIYFNGLDCADPAPIESVNHNVEANVDHHISTGSE